MRGCFVLLPLNRLLKTEQEIPQVQIGQIAHNDAMDWAALRIIRILI
jgi:hypothetical protein